MGRARQAITVISNRGRHHRRHDLLRPTPHRARRLTRFAALAAVATLAVLLRPQVALAHLHLERATPAPGSRVDRLPHEIRLTFSEAAELAMSSITLTGPDGRPVPLGALISDDRGTTIAARIAGTLGPGTYTVIWRAASADGHPVRGRYAFTLLPGATESVAAPQAAAPQRPAAPSETAAVRATPNEPHPNAATEAAGGALSVTGPVYDVVRWLGYVALVTLLGMLSFARLVVPRAVRRATGIATLAPTAERRAASIGVLASLLLVATTLARLIVQSYAVNGADGAWSAARLGGMVARTSWGWAWLLGVLAAALAVGALSAATRGRRSGWRLGATAAIGVALSFALSGHAAATPHLAPVTVLADTLHMLGAGGWLGTLLALVAVGIPLALREASPVRGRVVADLVNVFSPIALTCAALLAFTGILAAWIHLGTLGALWRSNYGFVLLVKLAVVVAVAALGALNWRVMKPSLGDLGSARRLRRSAMAELAMGALVLAVTAMLVATPPPAEAARSQGAPRVAGGP